MKRKSRILFIIIGIIIGLGISIKFNSINKIFANNNYYENDNSGNNNYKDYSKKFIEAAKKVSPATVYIYTEKTINTRGFRNQRDPLRDFFGDDFFNNFFQRRYDNRNFNRNYKEKVRSLGSGVIISKTGYILTNNHVVENADKIKVKIKDYNEYTAKLVGADKKSDLAVLKIEGNDFPYAKLGNSDNLEIGEWIIAIGNPFGLSHTVTAGIISAKGRSNLNINKYENFIQTDCSINPGNSGGPMINLNGSVIGINTAIYTKTGTNNGIGFAIPINMAKKIITDLISTGKVRRGYLGVVIQEINENMTKQFGLKKNQHGALIAQVYKNSPADKCGLMEGDVITNFDGKKIDSTNTLKNIVASTNIGKNIEIKVIRNGEKKSLNLTIVEQPTNFDSKSFISGNSKYNDDKLGLTLKTLNRNLAKQFNYPSNLRGVIILSIKRNSFASESGLQIGDVILEIDRKKINDLKEYNKAIELNQNSKNLLLKIQRNDQRMYLILEK